MKNKKIIGLTAVSLVMCSAVISANASNEATGQKRMSAENFSEEHYRAEKIAVESGDYASWKAAVETCGNTKILENVTEENFARFAEAFKLRESGDLDGSKAIMEELGINPVMGENQRGERGEMKMQDKDNHEAVDEAIESGDYETWKSLMDERGGGKILEIVNADNFSQFAEAKILQSEDKMEEAKAILDELGFPFQERKAQKRGMGMRGAAAPAEYATASN
ncbi:MAG: hypothetical protein WC178_00800 [Candidatus Paceibacterota bacterium]